MGKLELKLSISIDLFSRGLMPKRTTNGHAEHWKSSGENLFYFFCQSQFSY
jgi:hypothetical protein